MRSTAFRLFPTAATLLLLACGATITVEDDGEHGGESALAEGPTGGSGGAGESGGMTSEPTTCQPGVPTQTVAHIARLSPVGLSAAGVSGITFDGVADPLVIDGFGKQMWRVSASTGAVTASYALAVPETNTRTLAFDGEHLLTTRRATAMDALATVNLDAGTVAEVGAVGEFNFLGLAVDPNTSELWMVNDCADFPGCRSAHGGRLWRVEPSTAAATPVVELSPMDVAAATALAIADDGTFYVAVLIQDHAEIWTMDPTTGAGSLALDPQLGCFSIITDLEFQPGTQRLFGIAEARGADPRTWYLVSFGE